MIKVEEEVPLVPIGMQVLAVMPEIDEKTAKGIIKSEAMIAKERAEMKQYLTILAVGDEVTKIKVGDKVITGQNTTFLAVPVNDVKYIAFSANSIALKYK